MRESAVPVFVGISWNMPPLHGTRGRPSGTKLFSNRATQRKQRFYIGWNVQEALFPLHSTRGLIVRSNSSERSPEGLSSSLFDLITSTSHPDTVSLPTVKQKIASSQPIPVHILPLAEHTLTRFFLGLERTSLPWTASMVSKDGIKGQSRCAVFGCL